MAATQCAVIELEAQEPIRLANILKKAWMEAGIKRGLKGTVTVPEATGKVQILAEGPLDRLQSFADWCGKEEGVEANIVDLDSCPAMPLSPKFSLADAEDENAQPWRKLLESTALEVSAAMGKRANSDEGLA